ncbi:hypothetical protein BJ878DRAFT_546869 [Calycina marina]|uniref:Sucrose transporter n=1 Tax=Calycina marina TaxID=1763456 RepID=A0A9P8CAU5_9HELO|nr:hypothetical protein BJ878DRAFT_546869 [Calycina marina]
MRNESQTSQITRSRLSLLCLTISAGGLQMIWVAVMGQGSPLLTDLGVPAYLISLIWLAGPLSGVFVQPIMSILSDCSSHPWGRRRPFIIIGTIFTIFPVIILPWTADVVDIMMPSTNTEKKDILVARTIFAGLLIWIFNIAVQPVQVCMRALVIDSCPLSQQVQASAYVSRIAAIGSVLGYASGFLNLPRALPWLGTTQYQCVFSIAAFSLVLSVLVTCITIQEGMGPRIRILGKKELSGIISVIRQLLRSVRIMPNNMRTVCKVQFWSWLGWFPFLFYITTYLGNIYEIVMSASTSDDVYIVQKYSVHSGSIRLGTMTMVIFASTSFFSTLILPNIVSATSIDPMKTTRVQYHASIEEAKLEFPLDASLVTLYLRMKNRIQISRPTIPQAWAASNVLTSLVLLAAIFPSSSMVVMIQVSLLGISWAVTQ